MERERERERGREWEGQIELQREIHLRHFASKCVFVGLGAYALLLCVGEGFLTKFDIECIEHVDNQNRKNGQRDSETEMMHIYPLHFSTPHTSMF